MPCPYSTKNATYVFLPQGTKGNHALTCKGRGSIRTRTGVASPSKGRGGPGIPMALTHDGSGEKEAERGTRTSAGRIEKRTAKAVPVELFRLDPSMPPEATFTQNVSPLGARLLTKQPLQRGQRVLVKSLQNGLRARAFVAYCEHLPSNNAFAVGLRLVTPAPEWGTPP